MALPIGFVQDPEMPPGVGTFQFDNGAELYAEEPELAMRLSSAPQPQPLAQNDLGVERDMGAWSNPNAPQPQARPVATDAAPPAATPQPIVAAPQAPPPVAPAPQQQSPYTDEELSFISRPVVAPGRPGVDPHRMRAEGVPVPQSVTTTVKGTTPAPPIPDEMRERYAAAQQDYDATQLRRLDYEQARADHEASRLEVDRLRLADEAYQRQRALQAKEDAYNEKRARMQAEIDAANSGERVNTNMFTQRGTIGGIFLAIGQALSAAAGPQYLGQFNSMLQRQTEMDVAEQEREISDRKKARSNQLSAFTEQWGGDIEAGKTALKIAQSQLIDKEIAAYAASTRREDVQLKAQEWLAQRELERAELEQQLYVKAMGGGQEMTQVVNEVVVQPQRASGGGARAPTIEERYERAGKLGKLKAGMVESQRTIEGEPDPNVAARANAALGKVSQENFTKYAEKKTQLEDSKVALKQLARDYGVSLDERTGKVSVPKGWSGIPGTGATGFLPKTIGPFPTLSEQGRSVRDAQTKAAAAYTRAMSGASTTEQEQKRLSGVITGSTSDEDAVRQLQRAWEDVHAKESSIEAEYQPEIVEAHEMRKRQVNTQRAAPAAKVRPF